MVEQHDRRLLESREIRREVRRMHQMVEGLDHTVRSQQTFFYKVLNRIR